MKGVYIYNFKIILKEFYIKIFNKFTGGKPMFKKIISFFTVFIMVLTMGITIPVKTAMAAMPIIVATEPQLSSNAEVITENISTDTDIKIKFSKDMDVNTLKITGSSCISLYEVKDNNIVNKKSIFSSELDKSYDNETFTLTLKTSKYLQKNSIYAIKVQHSLIKAADGDFMDINPDSTYFYFSTKKDTTPKVGALYFSREFSADTIVQILNGGNTPGKAGSKVYIYFSNQMDSTTVNKENVLLKDKDGNVVEGYNIEEDTTRQAGRRYILTTSSAMNGLYTINFTEDIKANNGEFLDVQSSQICTPVVITGGKKAVSFNVNYDTTPYKINSASVKLTSGNEGNMMVATSEATAIEDAKTTGEFNIIFDEKIDIDKLTIAGSKLVPAKLAIFKNDTAISSSFLKVNYTESENKLKVQYNTLEPNQVYKLKILKSLPDYVGTLASKDSEFYFKTSESKEGPKLFKVFYEWSSLGEKKYVTDLTQNILDIKTRANNQSTKPNIKIFFDMNVKTSIVEGKELTETTNIRVFDKDMNILKGFTATYNELDSSVGIFVSQDENLEAKNPCYIALTNDILAAGNSNTFVPTTAFGGTVKTLEDGKQAILLPFKFDIAPPKYSVAPAVFGMGGLKKPVQLESNGTITINFNEPMNTTDSFYGLRNDARNIILAVRRDDALDENEIPLVDVNYDEIKLSESEYIMTPTSVTLKPDWSKYGVGKTFRLNMKEFRLADEAGWIVNSEMYAYSWFQIKSSQIAPAFELKVIDKPEYFTLGKEANIKVEAINNSKIEGTATIVIGLFDENNVLINYVALSEFIASSKNVLIEGKMSLPKKGQYKIKCFMWDNIKNMNKITDVIEVPVK
jgi:hypothetical protein